VELLWKTDRGGRVLEVSVELPGSKIPGAGVTIDLCTEISRDLSAALDVADVIPGAYRLQVGSPGVERALYVASDYERFKGQLAKVKVSEPLAKGQRTVRATIVGLNENGQVVLEADGTEVVLDLERIESARLLFEWNKGPGPGAKRSKKSAQRKADRETASRGSQQSR
jgi:ribosome maturation factor RimP